MVFFLSNIDFLCDPEQVTYFQRGLCSHTAESRNTFSCLVSRSVFNFRKWNISVHFLKYIKEEAACLADTERGPDPLIWSCSVRSYQHFRLKNTKVVLCWRLAQVAQRRNVLIVLFISFNDIFLQNLDSFICTRQQSSKIQSLWSHWVLLLLPN